MRQNTREVPLYLKENFRELCMKNSAFLYFSVLLIGK